jgi:hypothetical protein
MCQGCEYRPLGRADGFTNVGHDSHDGYPIRAGNSEVARYTWLTTGKRNRTERVKVYDSGTDTKCAHVKSIRIVPTLVGE